MIPKRVHYCWFGNNPETELMESCLLSWKKLLPDYEVKRWDEKNSPMLFGYLQRAAKHKKWANMSNFVRLYALFAEGGIYLDTDVQVVKSFDSLLGFRAFLGCESKDPRVNNAVFGSEPGHPFVLRMMCALFSSFSGQEPANESSPILTTRLLIERGLKGYSETTQIVANVAIFPVRYFYPFYLGEVFRPACITPDTYTLHHWAKSWRANQRLSDKR
jgi:mannosyltransferase OCH1-like enzyme